MWTTHLKLWTEGVEAKKIAEFRQIVVEGVADTKWKAASMTVYVIIHTTVNDTETHHREIVPKIMRAVQRHGGKRIALGHGEQLRAHVGEPPNANRLVVHEFPSLEAVEAWVEDVKANREQFHTLGDLTIISVPAI